MAFSRQQFSDAAIAELRAMLAWWRRLTVGGVKAGRRSSRNSPPMEIMIYGELKDPLHSGTVAQLEEHSDQGPTGRMFDVHGKMLRSGHMLEAGEHVMALWHWGDSRYYLVQSINCPLAPE